MRVLIDGDSFPDIYDIINLCKRYNVEVNVYIDSSHDVTSSYANIIVVDRSANAADIVLENETKTNDLVLTGDYGVAVVALSKNALVLNQYGNYYTNSNIDYLMDIKNTSRKLRKHINIKGPRKRKKKDTERLLNNIEEIIKRGVSNG